MAVLNVSDELARTAVGLFDYLNAGAPAARFRPKEPKFSAQDAITALLETRLVGDLEQARFAIDRLLQLGVVEESKGTAKRRKAADSKGLSQPKRIALMYRFRREMVTALERSIAPGKHPRKGFLTGISRQPSVNVTRTKDKSNASKKPKSPEDVELSSLAQLSAVAALVAISNMGSHFTRPVLLWRIGTWAVHFDLQIFAEAALVVLAATLWFFIFVHRDMFEEVVDDGGGRRTEAPHDRYKEALEERVSKVDITDRLRKESLDAILDDIYKLMNGDRAIDAGELLHALERQLLALPHSDEVEAFRERMQRDLVKLSRIHKKFETALLAVTEFAADASGWTATGKTGTCDTFRKVDSRGNFHVKVETTLQGDPLHCLALWREGNLYHEWLPFCTSSRFVDEVGRAEAVVGYELSFCPPIFGAEIFVHGFGVEHLSEGQFLILSEGVEYWPPGSREPIKQRGQQAYIMCRPKIASVKICIEVWSTTRVRHSMIMSVRGGWKTSDFVRQHALAAILSTATSALQRRMDRMRDTSSPCSHLDVICAPRSLYTRWLQPILTQCIESKMESDQEVNSAVNNGDSGSEYSNARGTPFRSLRRASTRRSIAVPRFISKKATPERRHTVAKL